MRVLGHFSITFCGKGSAFPFPQNQIMKAQNELMWNERVFLQEYGLASYHPDANSESFPCTLI